MCTESDEVTPQSGAGILLLVDVKPADNLLEGTP
jgi:hypothetical protein